MTDHPRPPRVAAVDLLRQAVAVGVALGAIREGRAGARLPDEESEPPLGRGR